MTDRVVEEIEIKGDSSNAQAAAAAFEKRMVQALERSKKAATEFEKSLEKATDFWTGSFTRAQSKRLAAQKEQIKADNEATASTKKVGAATLSLSTQIGILTGLYYGVIPLVRKVIGGSLEYEKSTIRLSNAIRSQGSFSQENLEILQHQASELQKLTGTSDETARGMLALATSMGVPISKARSFVEAAIRMANATGRDATGSMQQLIKTLGGVAGELGELVPSVRSLTKEELESGKAVELINKQWKTFLGQGITGESGALTQMRNGWDDITEAIGRAVTKTTLYKTITSSTSGVMSAIAKIIEKEGFATGVGAATTLLFDATGFNQMLGWKGGNTGGVDAVFEMFEGLSKEDKANVMALQALKTASIRSKDGFDFSGQESVGGFSMDEPKKKEAKKDPFDFGGFGGEKMDEMVLIGDGLLVTKEVADARLAASEDFNQRYLNGVKRRNDFERDLNAFHLQRVLEQEQQAAEERQRIADMVTQMMANSVVTAFERMLEGQKAGAGELAVGFIKTVGRMLLAQGLQHIFAAAANLFMPGLQGTSAPLMAIAKAEVAAGAAMMASGKVVASALGMGGGSGSGRGGRVSRDFDGGAGTRSRAEQEKPKTEQINITVNGAVTPAEAGVQIKRALDEARREGLLS